MNLPDHGSYGFFNLFHQCPLRWYFKYILRLPEPKSGEQYLGLAVHEVLDRIHRGISPDLYEDHFEDVWNTQPFWEEKTPPEEIDWGKKDEGKAQEKANRLFNTGFELLREYLHGPHFPKNSPAFHGESILSEWAFKIPLQSYGGKYLRTLDGRLDLVTSDGRLIDFKTRTYSKISQDSFKTDLQPLIYAWALDEMKVASPPITFRYGQFVHGQVRDPFFYNEDVGGVIKPWQVDVMRQVVIPGRVRDAEEVLDRIASNPGMMLGVRPGSHCKYDPWMNKCPLFMGK